MSSLRQAAEMALEALEGTTDFIRDDHHVWSAVTALRAALDAPQDPVAYNGWVLREVLFDNGEPVGHREPTKAEPQEPVLVVEKEPDYWSGGHFYKGDKPHIDPTKVWGLQIGTKLYTAPQTPKI